MGEILDLEEDVLGIRRYRRIKVLLDVTKLLRRYWNLKDKKRREFQVDFNLLMKGCRFSVLHVV